MKGRPGVGDVWTWTAMDADSKLMISWLVGERDAGYAADFINDLAERLATRVQLTTDGLKVYLEAIEGAFGADIDYAQLVKRQSSRGGTVRPSVPDVRRYQLREDLILDTSQHRLWSGRI